MAAKVLLELVLVPVRDVDVGGCVNGGIGGGLVGGVDVGVGNECAHGVSVGIGRRCGCSMAVMGLMMVMTKHELVVAPVEAMVVVWVGNRDGVAGEVRMWVGRWWRPRLGVCGRRWWRLGACR